MTVYDSNINVAYKLQLEVTQQSQSVGDNTSTLSWTLKLVKTNAAYSANSTSGDKFKVIIDGLTVLNANKAWDLRTASSVTIASGTKTVTHESNGTKSVPVSFSFTPSSSPPYYPGALSGSGTFTCTTIPRISSVSVNKTSADVGTSVTISIGRAASSYTHNLYYKVANGSNVAIGTGIATSEVWNIPANLLPNNSSAPVTITCDTYNGSTKVGTSTCALTVTVPSAAVPSITAVTVSESADTSDIETKFGVYVQNQSRLEVLIDAAGIYGSTISSYSTVVDGTTYTGSAFTTNPIASSGDVIIKTTVRDSRGKTATYTETVSVVEYTAPTLSNVYAFRCDENGLAKEDGAYLKVGLTYFIRSVSGMNDKLLEIQYKADGSDTWNAFITDSSAYARTNVTVISSSQLLDTDTSYAVRIMVSDYFYSGDTAVVNVRQISAAFTLINFGANGRSIAIGQQSSNDGRLECAIPANFYAGLHSNGDMVAVNPSIALTEVSPAVSSHSTGELFVYEGKLYRATSPIARGESLVPGTNIALISLAGIIGNGPLTTAAKTIIQAINELNNFIKQTIKDYVIEQGNNYRKWNSGKLECYGNITFNTAISTAWGGIYRSARHDGANYPVEFKAINGSTMSVSAYNNATGTDGAWIFTEGNGTLEKTPGFYMARGATLTTAKTWVVGYYTIGTWK